MRQQEAAIFLAVMVAGAFASSLPISSGSPMIRNRFLAAGLGPKNKKYCTKDPSVCASGLETCCGDSCADTGTDPLNCGKCGQVCKFTDSCCDGKCTDLAYNKKHCGKCNNQCKKRCFYGMCDYA